MELFKYNPAKSCLFIDSSQRDLKSVLLNNGGKFACIRVILKEHYTNVNIVIQKLCFDEYKWMV